MDRHAKAALRKELQRAELQRDQLDAVIAYLRGRLAVADEDEVVVRAPAAMATASPDPPSISKNRPPKRLTASVAAIQVLRREGRPMRTPELLAEIHRLGATMKNTDSLYKTLDRNERFRREGRGMWALAEWPSGPRGAALFDQESG